MFVSETAAVKVEPLEIIPTGTVALAPSTDIIVIDHDDDDMDAQPQADAPILLLPTSNGTAAETGAGESSQVFICHCWIAKILFH